MQSIDIVDEENGMAESEDSFESIDLTQDDEATVITSIQCQKGRSRKKRQMEMIQTEENEMMEIDAEMPPSKLIKRGDAIFQEHNKPIASKSRIVEEIDLENFMFKRNGKSLFKHKTERAQDNASGQKHDTATQEEEEEKPDYQIDEELSSDEEVEQCLGDYDEEEDDDYQDRVVFKVRRKFGKDEVKVWNPTNFKKPRCGMVLVEYEFYHNEKPQRRRYLMRASEITQNLWEMMTYLHGRGIEDSIFTEIEQLMLPVFPECEKNTLKSESSIKFNQIFWTAWHCATWDRNPIRLDGDSDSDDAKDSKEEEDGVVEPHEQQKWFAPAIKAVLLSQISRHVPNNCIIDMRYVGATVLIKEPEGLFDMILPRRFNEWATFCDIPKKYWREQIRFVQQSSEKNLFPPNF